MNIIQDITDPFAHSYSIALNSYPMPVVKNAEKIYKYETGNYSSTIWKNTKGAGAEASGSAYPWNWSDYTYFWKLPWLKPTGLYLSSNGSAYIKFLTFTAGLLFLCEFLNNNNNNPGRWNSTDPAIEATYNAAISQISNDYVV